MPESGLRRAYALGVRRRVPTRYGGQMSTTAPLLLFVHAHPDDETLATGVALAHYARAGAAVHVLTCTLGDEGEVIPAELAHLAPDRDDTLGPYRRGELRDTMRTLGVHERVLGEDPESLTGAAYRDSGMAGTDENNDERALCRAPLAEVAEAIREHIAALRPDAVVTYDATGGYGHPDHIRVHEATRAAVAGLPEQDRPPLFVTLVPSDVAASDRDWLREHVPASPQHDIVTIPSANDPYPPSVVDPALITHVVEGSADDLALRDQALRHHRTQVSVYDGFYALSNDIAARLARAEYFALVDPETGELLGRRAGLGASADYEAGLL